MSRKKKYIRRDLSCRFNFWPYLILTAQCPKHDDIIDAIPFVCVFPSVELQKANLEAQNSPNTGGSSSGPAPSATSPLASAIPLAQLLAKPGALNALSSLSALGGLTELLGAQSGGAPVQTTGVHRAHKPYAPRMRSPGGQAGPADGPKLKERNKFNPYWKLPIGTVSWFAEPHCIPACTTPYGINGNKVLQN